MNSKKDKIDFVSGYIFLYSVIKEAQTFDVDEGLVGSSAAKHFCSQSLSKSVLAVKN